MPSGSRWSSAHEGQVTSASFSADGSQVLTAADDGAVRLVGRRAGRAARGRRARRPGGERDVQPGRTRILSASDDETAASGASTAACKPQVLEGHTDWVRSAAFSPSDSQKVVTDFGRWNDALWDLASPGRGRLSQEGSTVFEGAFDRQGERLVTAVRDNTARVWKATDLARGGSALDTHGELRDHRAAPRRLGHGRRLQRRRLPDRRRHRETARCGSGSAEDGTQKVVKQFAHAGIAASSARRSARMAAASWPRSSDGVARVWRVDGPDQPMELRHSQDVNEAVFSSRGDWIATASKDGTARLWNARDGGERVVLRHGTESVRALAFDSTDSRLVTGTSDGIVRVWRITVASTSRLLAQCDDGMPRTAGARPFSRRDRREGMGGVSRVLAPRFGRTPVENVRGRRCATAVTRSVTTRARPAWRDAGLARRC